MNAPKLKAQPRCQAKLNAQERCELPKGHMGQHSRGSSNVPGYPKRWNGDHDLADCTVVPTGSPEGWVQARSIHDEEVSAMRERVASSWVSRALAGELPAKEYAR